MVLGKYIDINFLINEGANMKKLSFTLMLNILLILITSSCVSAVRYDGPYEGRVIDADTGEPIEGVVVLGVWNKEYPTAGGAVHKFHDARETKTDENGEFSIQGMGVEILSNVIPMDVLIFKAGYEHIGMGPWASFKKSSHFRKIIKWEGNRAIIPLKKWTIEERKNRFGSYYVNIPNEKKRLLLQEVDKEKNEISK